MEGELRGDRESQILSGSSSLVAVLIRLVCVGQEKRPVSAASGKSADYLPALDGRSCDVYWHEKTLATWCIAKDDTPYKFSVPFYVMLTLRGQSTRGRSIASDRAVCPERGSGLAARGGGRGIHAERHSLSDSPGGREKGSVDLYFNRNVRPSRASEQGNNQALTNQLPRNRSLKVEVSRLETAREVGVSVVQHRSGRRPKVLICLELIVNRLVSDIAVISTRA